MPPEKKEQFARAAAQLSAGNIALNNACLKYGPITPSNFQAINTIINQVTYFLTADLLLELSHLAL